MDRLPPVVSTSIDQVIRGFVPTRRFAHVSFDTYQPDPRYPSQLVARDRLRTFAAHIGQPIRADIVTRLLKKAPERPPSIYLDGGYGIGKTHLLAATYHAVEDQRAYLSFGELAYTISRLGLDASLRALKKTHLLCIDEFELDDVAQTRMAATFLRRQLEAVHPVHYAQIATKLDALFLHDLQRIDDQAVALRLVHFVDKLYDQEVRVTLTTRSDLPLVEIFSAAYRTGGYEKKYRRCLSRLHELVSETGMAAATRLTRRGNGQDTGPAPRPAARPSGQTRSD